MDFKNQYLARYAHKCYFLVLVSYLTILISNELGMGTDSIYILCEYFGDIHSNMINKYTAVAV